MDDDTRTRRAKAAETLERILSEHHDDYDEWERGALRGAIAHLRGEHGDDSRTSPPSHT